MTAAQVSGWLKEQYREEVSERTVSRYVKQLREAYGLKKSDPPREHEAVPELPRLFPVHGRDAGRAGI